MPVIKPKPGIIHASRLVMKRLTSQQIEETLLRAPGLSSGYGVELDRKTTARLLAQVRGMLRRHLGAGDEVEDWVQIVFVEVLRALPKFKGESKLSTFVGGVTMQIVRRARRPSAWQRRACTLDEDFAKPWRAPEAQIQAREQLSRAHAALLQISPKKRSAFVQWALEGKSPNQIAARAGVSVAAARSRIFYAQKELKARAAKDAYLSQMDTVI